MHTHLTFFIFFSFLALIFCQIRKNLINAKDEYSEEEYNTSLQHINENIEEIKQHLFDDSMVVKKGTDRLTVKTYQINETS